MPHKFRIGQLVNYSPPRGLYAPLGPYIIAAQLPGRDGEFEYRIRHPNQVHDRIVAESDLSIAQVAATTSEITEYMGYRLDTRPVGKGWRVLIYPGLLYLNSLLIWKRARRRKLFEKQKRL